MNDRSGSYGDRRLQLIFLFGQDVGLIRLFLRFSSSLLYASALFSSALAVLYVSPTGSGTDGRSWATAYRTIGAAVAAASAGSQIWIRQGVYTENVVIRTAGLELYGGFAGDESALSERRGGNTVIDAGNSGRPVRIDFVPDVSLDRLVLRRGRAAGFGGGVYAPSADNLRLRDCIIEDCTSATNNSGGGIYVSNGSITLTDVTVRRCSTGDIGGGMRAIGANVYATGVVFEDNVASRGGGLALESGVGWVRGCIFRRNVATFSGLEGGGGAWLRMVQQIRIERNWFTENQAGAGAALDLLYRTTTRIYSNLFTRNVAGTATVLVRDTGTWPRMVNNTYSDNSSTVGNSVMYFYSQASATVRNENITFNTGPAAAIGRDASVTYYWAYCNFYENSVAPFSLPQDLNAAGPTTTQVDPKYLSRTFLDIPWSYCLRPDSPVRDYGFDEVPFDFCNAPRPIESSGYPVPYPDRGCFEYQAVQQYVTMTGWRGPTGDGDQSKTLLHLRVANGNGQTVFDSWVPQSANGFYLMPGEAFVAGSGPWTLRISAKGYLVARAHVSALPAHGSPGRNLTLVIGDTDGNNRVELADASRVLSTLSHSGAQPGDVNGDLVVDLHDLNAVFASFGIIGD